jgi:predicted ATPase/DNA-binding winged helix-turn-helix (wHTH) protein
VQGGADLATTESLRFGPFLLRPGARVLELDGQRVPLGGRAFDILTTLIERAGEVVSQKDLYERVWPGLNVNEASLRVQIRALRVALGAGDGDVTYVSNIPARGYCFVAPVSGGPPAPPPAEAPPPPIAPQTNLPRPVDAFVGRQSEIADLDERFFTQRLITLVGPGGNGKSRLAVELGWRLCERFPDGVWFVDLAPVANDEFAASAIAAAIGGDLHSGVSAGEALAASIGRRRMLLILDNCERLVRPIADLADVLLQKTPALSILATSQRPIGLAGEHIYRLDPLDLPPPGAADISGHSAVALFVERARETDRTFSLTPENAVIVGELCRRLDGVPLALEMAVARLPLLGLQGLRQGLDDRLRMLAPGRRGALSRHPSLRSMVEWSYELLDAAAAELFRRLAIFPGTFSLDAAVAVGGSQEVDDWDTLDALGRLIDRSLVMAEPVDPPRYRLLETHRLFASEHLQACGEYDLCSRKHAVFYCDMLEDITEYEERASDEMFLARFGGELDNVRAALDWALADSSRSDIAVVLGGGLFLILRALNLYLDAVFYWEKFAPLLSSRRDSIHLARLFKAAGEAIGPGDPRKGVDLVRRGIDMYSEHEALLLVAAAQVSLAALCVRMGDTDEAARLCEAAQPVLEGRNFALSRIRALQIEGLIAAMRNETARAKRLYYRSLELSRSSGKIFSTSSAMLNIALVEYAEGNFTEAVETGQLAMESLLSTRQNRLLCVSITNQSIYLCMAGRLAEARPMAEQALALAHAAGGWSVLACVLGWVLLLASEGHHREAAQLFGFLLEGNARAGIATLSYQDRTYERIRAIFADNLSPDELSASMEIGAAWTEDQAIAFALESGNVGASGLGIRVLD